MTNRTLQRIRLLCLTLQENGHLPAALAAWCMHTPRRRGVRQCAVASTPSLVRCAPSPHARDRSSISKYTEIVPIFIPRAVSAESCLAWYRGREFALRGCALPYFPVIIIFTSCMCFLVGVARVHRMRILSRRRRRAQARRATRGAAVCSRRAPRATAAARRSRRRRRCRCSTDGRRR